MARQFYSKKAGSKGSHSWIEFEKPVRKIMVWVTRDDVAGDVGIGLASADSVTPKYEITLPDVFHCPLYLDLQSANTGKGVKYISLYYSGSSNVEPFVSFSVVEYADESAADGEYFNT